MTDALAQYSLTSEQKGGDPWRRLCLISTNDELRDLVLSERAAGKMRQDDVTIVRLSYGREAQQPQPRSNWMDKVLCRLKPLIAAKPDGRGGKCASHQRIQTCIAKSERRF
jgi:hypothetical protein